MESSKEKLKLLCFDLDDTLIRRIHSVMFPCILNGKEKEHSIIQEEEDTGKIDYVTADYRRVKLLSGLDERKIEKHFLDIVHPLKNIKSTVQALHKLNIKFIIITVGPRQVAKAACNIWGFDGFFGSYYEVVDNIFTGNISKYISADEKIDCLIDFCKTNNISPDQCMAVGDGLTDIPIFEYCGKSIAINSSDEVKKRASFAVDTDDLSDILKYIY